MTLAYDPVHDLAPPEGGLGDLLFEMGAAVRFQPGEDIFSQGETADLIYGLVKGEVRLSCFAFGAHHDVDLLDAPGDLFGLEPGPAHEMSAEALSECVVLVASRSALAVMLGAAELDFLQPQPAERRPN